MHQQILCPIGSFSFFLFCPGPSGSWPLQTLSGRPVCTLDSHGIWLVWKGSRRLKAGEREIQILFLPPSLLLRGLAVAALLSGKSQHLSGSCSYSYSSSGVPETTRSPGPSDLLVLIQPLLAQRWSNIPLTFSLGFSHGVLMSTFVKFPLIILFVYALCSLPRTWVINENKS